MSDWSEAAAEAFKRDRQKAEQKIQKAQRDAESRRNGALPLWNELKGRVQQFAQEFNAAMGEQVLTFMHDDHEVVVVGHFTPNVSRLVMTFNAGGSSLAYRVEGMQGHSLAVVIDDRDQPVFSEGATQKSIDALGREMLNALLAKQRPS
jgi:hypothetical protein